MLIGDAIINLRKKRKIRQNELAAIIGISQTYLSQIENNHRRPNFEIIENIGLKLNIPVPVILFLAIDENDVNVEKRNLYKSLMPVMGNLIDEVFISVNDD